MLCTYNGAAHLREQLESIAAQTLPPCELIACDDGSTDATMEILEAFRRRSAFPVTIVRNERNLGSTANFDQGIERATGRFVALSDQDDLWLPEKLATLLPVLEGTPSLGGVFTDAFVLDERRHAGARPGGTTLWGMHGFTAARQRAFADRDGAIAHLLRADVATGATMVLRSSLRGLWHPIPASWVHDGWIAWMLAVHSRLQPVAEPLITYRVHARQQLGAGAGGALRQRRAKGMATERARYDRVAGQFDDLRERLAGTDPRVDLALREKSGFLRRRATLPSTLPRRVPRIAREMGAYARYARGWRSMRKDLFLG